MDHASQDTLVDYVKQRLRFQEWRGRNRFGQALFVRNAAVRDQDIPGWGSSRRRRIEPVWLAPDVRQPLREARRVARDATPDVTPPSVRTIWTVAGQPEAAVRIDLIECATREDAHERLVRIVADFESPLVGELAGPLGDVAFSGGGGGLALFARANLVYLLRNVGRRAVPVEGIALSLDAATVSIEDPALAATVPRRQANASDTPDAFVEVALEDTPTQGAPGCCKYMAPVGDLGMFDNRVLYRGPTSGLNQIKIYTRN